MYVQNQAPYPPVVVRFTIQLKKVALPERKVMKLSRAPPLHVMIEMSGRPDRVQYVKIRGACPRRARPAHI